MRLMILAGALALAACASQPPPATIAALASADAATALAVGQQLTMSLTTHAAPPGQEPVIVMTLRHADGRVMSFDESNHAPTHLMAQAPGGPLAQTMGLFGEESPTLYGVRPDEHRGEPFICGPDGPAALGLYEAPDGTVQVVGLKQQFTFESRPEGDFALPYSPDQVCARLRFRRG